MTEWRQANIGGKTPVLSSSTQKQSAKILSEIQRKRRRTRERLAAEGTISSADSRKLSPRDVAYLRDHGGLPTHALMARRQQRRQESVNYAAVRGTVANFPGASSPSTATPEGQLQNWSGPGQKRPTGPAGGRPIASTGAVARSGPWLPVDSLGPAARSRRARRVALARAGLISSTDVRKLSEREIAFLRSEGALPSGHKRAT